MDFSFFKLLLFLLFVGTFISLISAVPLPTMITVDTPTQPGWGGSLNVVPMVFNLMVSGFGFFTGITALFNYAAIPEPLNWILIVGIGFGWIFLLFELVKTVAKSVLP
jgi:hypothetical protein